MRKTPMDTPLTFEQETDLNAWYDELESAWQAKIADPKSPESVSLTEAEAAWEAEREYYHDRFLYADIF